MDDMIPAVDLATPTRVGEPATVRAPRSDENRGIPRADDRRGGIDDAHVKPRTLSARARNGIGVPVALPALATVPMSTATA
jgi:hypothetical protein